MLFRLLVHTPRLLGPDAVEVGRYLERAADRVVGRSGGAPPIHLEGSPLSSSTIQAVSPTPEGGALLGAAAMKAARGAHGLVVDLSSFGGPAPDPTSALLLGLVRGLGKPAWAWVEDPEDYGTRCALSSDDARPFWAECTLEPFDLRAPCVAEAALREVGAVAFRAVGWRQGVDLCLGHARAWFARRSG